MFYSDECGNSVTDICFVVTFFAVNFNVFGGGTWTFGALDSAQYTGSVSYTTAYNFNGYGYWGMNISGYSVGTGAPIPITLPIILDTGSSIAIMPPDLCAAYWAQVSGAGLPTIPQVSIPIDY